MMNAIFCEDKSTNINLTDPWVISRFLFYNIKTTQHKEKTLLQKLHYLSSIPQKKSEKTYLLHNDWLLNMDLFSSIIKVTGSF